MNAELLLQHFKRLSEAPDAIPSLRRFILDLAVRGKLLEQNPNDEPAAELLKRIQMEKVRLVKEGKLRKTKALEPIAEGDIEFDIPPLWVGARLGEVYDVRDGTHDTPKYVDTGYPLITSKNLSTGRLLFDDIKLISERDHLQIAERSLVKKDDILLAMIGSIGNPVVVDTDRPFSIKNVALFKYYDSAASNPSYLCLFLKYATSKMQQLATGGLQPFVSLGFLRSYPIALPPLAEQHRIVTKVDELMALCNELEAAKTEREQSRDRLVAASLHYLNQPADDEEAFREHAHFTFNHLPRITTRPAHIKQLRQTILNLAVRGRLVTQNPNDEPVKLTLTGLDSDREWPFDAPLTWGWRCISDLSVLVTDGEHATPTRIPEHQVPLVTAKNVRDGKMDYTSTDWVSFDTADKAWRRCRPMVGDILLVCVGATTGRICILREPKDMVLVRSVALIRSANIIDVDYLALAIRAPLGQSQIWNSQLVAGFSSQVKLS